MGFQFAERSMKHAEKTQSRFLAPPKPDSFFANASLQDVQGVLSDFYKDRPYMTKVNKKVRKLLTLVNGEVQEVLRDCTPEEGMSRESYKNQEISDISIFLLAIAGELRLPINQDHLESHAHSVFQSQERFVSSKRWTRQHEGLYWSLLGTLSWKIQQLQRVGWGETLFEDLSDEQWRLLAKGVQEALEISWTLHRLHGRSPTQEMLDKIGRNAGKYAAGLDKDDAKAFYKDRNMNSQYFAEEYLPLAPAVLGTATMFDRVQSGIRSHVTRAWAVATLR